MSKAKAFRDGIQRAKQLFKKPKRPNLRTRLGDLAMLLRTTREIQQSDRRKLLKEKGDRVVQEMEAMQREIFALRRKNVEDNLRRNRRKEANGSR